ncbi:importin-5-like [Quillaja saponaria]|uniref:Importin-5-like n=1 Tax=Quillaja saponaria TaxID=32244 RepID=A0AAD7PRQ8_QUISA|nr:importin-5-like [Quillaja saponaria]
MILREILCCVASRVYAAPGGNWDELRDYVISSINSESEHRQEVGLSMFREIPQIVGSSLTPIPDSLQMRLLELFTSLSSHIQFLALSATFSFACKLDEYEGHADMSNLLLGMINLINDNWLAGGQKELVEKGLEGLSNLARKSPDFLFIEKDFVLETMIRIAESDFGSDIRCAAIDVLIGLDDAAMDQMLEMMKTMSSEMIRRIISILMDMIACFEDDPVWYNMETDQEDNNSGLSKSYYTGVCLLDRISFNGKENIVVSIAFKLMSEYLASDNWKKRYSGVKTLDVIEDSCPQEVTVDYFDQAVTMISTSLRDAHPRVRCFATNFIIQRNAEFRAKLAVYNLKILPPLVAIIDDFQNPFLQEQFHPIYNDTMESLKAVLCTDSDASGCLIRVKSAECMCSIHKDLNKGKFGTDVTEVLAQLCRFLEKDSVTFLKDFVPKLLQSAELSIDADAAMPKLLLSALSAVKEENGYDMSYMQELALRIIPALLQALYELDNSAEEREMSISIFNYFVQQCKEAANRYYDIYMPILMQACTDDSPYVRKEAAKGISLCAVVGRSKFEAIADVAAGCLECVIRHPNASSSEGAMAHDAAVSALGKIMEYQYDSINAYEEILRGAKPIICWLVKLIMEMNLPKLRFKMQCEEQDIAYTFMYFPIGLHLGQVVQTWLNCLPLKNDWSEAKIAHAQLANMLQWIDGDLLGPENEHLPKVLSVIKQVLAEKHKLATEATAILMEELLSHLPGIHSALLSALASPNHVVQIRAIWGCGQFGPVWLSLVPVKDDCRGQSPNNEKSRSIAVYIEAAAPISLSLVPDQALSLQNGVPIRQTPKKSSTVKIHKSRVYTQILRAPPSSQQRILAQKPNSTVTTTIFFNRGPPNGRSRRTRRPTSPYHTLYRSRFH